MVEQGMPNTQLVNTLVIQLRYNLDTTIVYREACFYRRPDQHRLYAITCSARQKMKEIPIHSFAFLSLTYHLFQP